MELLIAVCILAVAVIPMLRSFISSLYANAKARERLSAMMVAEDIVEGLKGHSYEEAAEAFVNYSPDKFSLLAEGIVKGDTEITTVSSDGTLEVKIKNLHARTTDKTADRAYDAIVNINALDYRTAEGGTEKNTDYNTRPLAVVKNMSNIYDAIFFSNYPKDWQDVQDNIYKDHTDIYGSPDDVKMEDVSRLFEVVIDKPDDDVDERISVKVLVKYYLVKDGASIGDATHPILKEYDVYDNIDTYEAGGTFKNLYFFYYPGYEFRSQAFNSQGLIGGVSHDDTIIINNKKDIPCTVYLTKQIRYDATQLYTDEVSYRPKVYINEGSAAGEAVTDICSNYKINLADESELAGIDNGIFELSPAGKSFPANFEPFKGLSETAMDRIFSVEVQIFEKGKDFKREKRVATLSSSTID